MSREQPGPQTGRVSARVVEEAYLDLQHKFREYRISRDYGGVEPGADAEDDEPDVQDVPDENPALVLQDSVQTFFEFVRPYINNEPSLREYWEGALAAYPDQRFRDKRSAKLYYLEHSTGVWQVQTQPVLVTTGPAATGTTAGPGPVAITDGGSPPESAEGWHRRLDLPQTTRVLRWSNASESEEFDYHYLDRADLAVLGLREVADWSVTERERSLDKNGFMAHKAGKRTVREGEPAAKIEAAARMLIDVADELGVIAGFDVPDDREASFEYSHLI